ncbi:MAG: bifunctional 4-hydroxy-2-oxoglutarate aldolase/2-dehydro-3-deoxy-phosphogluconate aldolase [Caulobacterales bacterium]|nr:bifunctional 4-hydroxy-2-oxoglutarate aldolase/2-dehydro-3-deoxy-phosphogluconate aldolase [Caulobacterales bacterium]
MASINELKSAGVIPVIELDRVEGAAPLARALLAGGLKVAELTLRTQAALPALGAMREVAPELVVGMGSIRSADDVKRSLDAGAAFLVSPGASAALLGAMKNSGVLALPGVATASEAMTAAEAGFAALKFFPAESAGGVPFLKALAGPLPEILFCPTGGVGAEKAQEYLALSNVFCVGGSWVATREMIRNGEWRAIEANARCAAALASRSEY